MVTFLAPAPRAGRRACDATRCSTTTIPGVHATDSVWLRSASGTMNCCRMEPEQLAKGDVLDHCRAAHVRVIAGGVGADVDGRHLILVRCARPGRLDQPRVDAAVRQVAPPLPLDLAVDGTGEVPLSRVSVPEDDCVRQSHARTGPPRVAVACPQIVKELRGTAILIGRLTHFEAFRHS
eukprot:scaffold2782_cov112-Isochrysis_galbana.AAC.5